LKSAAPSGGFAVGKAICAEAAPTIDTALQNASAMTATARRRLMDISVGADRA
jgi:hypothetical protein